MLILKPFIRESWSVDAAVVLASITFITRVGFCTSTLAYLIDSLVRVSRRVGKNHFGKIAQSFLRHRSLQQTQADPRRGPGLQSFWGNDTSFCLTVGTQLSLPQVAKAAFNVHAPANG